MIWRHCVAGRSDWLQDENLVKQIKKILQRRWHLRPNLKADHLPHPPRRTKPRHMFPQLSRRLVDYRIRKWIRIRQSVVFLRWIEPIKLLLLLLEQQLKPGVTITAVSPANNDHTMTSEITRPEYQLLEWRLRLSIRDIGQKGERKTPRLRSCAYNSSWNAASLKLVFVSISKLKRWPLHRRGRSRWIQWLRKSDGRLMYVCSCVLSLTKANHSSQSAGFVPRREWRRLILHQNFYSVTCAILFIMHTAHDRSEQEDVAEEVYLS